MEIDALVPQTTLPFAQVDNLRTQLTQIEHTTTNRCQDFEDAVDAFQTKVNTMRFGLILIPPLPSLQCDTLDAHVHKLMDNSGISEAPKVNQVFRKFLASLLSFLLVLLAFILNIRYI